MRGRPSPAGHPPVVVAGFVVGRRALAGMDVTPEDADRLGVSVDVFPGQVPHLQIERQPVPVHVPLFRRTTCPPVQDGSQRGLFFNRLQRSPGLAGRAAPRGAHQPDRAGTVPLQFSGEMVGDGGEIPGAVGCADNPGALEGAAKGRLQAARHREQAKVRPIRPGQRFLRVSRGTQRPLHVGLPRGQPDLAHQDVLPVETNVAGDEGHTVRAAGRDRRPIQLPASGFVGPHRGRAVVERAAHLRPGPGPARRPNRPVGLQHHVLAPRRIDPQRRVLRGRRRNRRRQGTGQGTRAKPPGAHRLHHSIGSGQHFSMIHPRGDVARGFLPSGGGDP